MKFEIVRYLTKYKQIQNKFNYISYWEDRYANDGTSGSGSYGENALYKSSVIKGIYHANNIQQVLDFGCGDGNLLIQMSFINEYLGVDISAKSIEICNKKFSKKQNYRFLQIEPNATFPEIGNFDLVICLEVLMHITNEHDFIWTLDQIFQHSNKIVVLQAPIIWETQYKFKKHETNRNLLPYLAKYLNKFSLIDIIIHPSTSIEGRLSGETGQMYSDFLVFKKSITNFKMRNQYA